MQPITERGEQRSRAAVEKIGVPDKIAGLREGSARGEMDQLQVRLKTVIFLTRQGGQKPILNRIGFCGCSHDHLRCLTVPMLV